MTLPGLVRLLESSRFRSGTLLVCDGTGSSTGLDGSFTHPDAPVRVVFAGPGKDADSAIARLVMEEERKGRAGTVTVVSSDKGVLASAIGPFGPKARRMTSEQFMRMVLDDAGRSASLGSGGAEPARPTLDAESARQWMREFGIEPGPRIPREPEQDAPEELIDPGSESRATQGPGSENRGTQSGRTQEWPDGIDPDDLDMRKWLKE